MGTRISSFYQQFVKKQNKREIKEEKLKIIKYEIRYNLLRGKKSIIITFIKNVE